MIIFHRNSDRAYCDAIEERLQDLVLAHRVAPAGCDGSTDEPYVTEGKHVYRGHDEIASFLGEVEEEIGFSRQISADACYIDPDDPSRCI